MTAQLKFKVHEVNPSSGEVEDDGFDEEYPMEDIEVSASDLMAKVSVNDFRSAWEHVGDAAEVKGSYGLKYKSLVEGVAAVIENLGMQPCENTAVPQPKAKAHILLLSGVFVGGVKALVKSRISLDEQSGSMILQVRTDSSIFFTFVCANVALCRWLCVRRRRRSVKPSWTALDKIARYVRWSCPSGE
jgi:coatomer protein complex subunit gamma